MFGSFEHKSQRKTHRATTYAIARPGSRREIKSAPIQLPGTERNTTNKRCYGTFRGTFPTISQCRAALCRRL